MALRDWLPEASTSFAARNGYALVGDLAQPDFAALSRELERFQLEFLALTRPIWSADFPIPGDALGHFSRQWEYPYAWANLASLRGRLLDAGSGITFFPFLLAAAGMAVDACDEDGSLQLHDRFALASRLAGCQVNFEQTSLSSLSYADNTFDAATCISVLEHTGPARQAILCELQRVLKPGGRLILTLDVNLSRDDDVRLEDLAQLLSELRQTFELTYPLDLHRPPGLLSSDHVLGTESWRLPWTWRVRPGVPSAEFRSIAVLGVTADKRRLR